MLGWSALPSNVFPSAPPSAASSMSTYSMVGFALAESFVAAASAKPTVTITLQPSETRLVRLGAKSLVLFDSTAFSVTPSSAAACLAPSYDNWLNDLSSKPPASDTMQGRNLLVALALPPALVPAVPPAVGAWPHAVSAVARTAVTQVATTLVRLFTKLLHRCTFTLSGAPVVILAQRARSREPGAPPMQN